MNQNNLFLQPIANYFTEKFINHGTTPSGLDWPSQNAMDVRFQQIMKICDTSHPFSLIDYGCGYGALVDHMINNQIQCEYYGYDLVDTMVEQAKRIHKNIKFCHFTGDLSSVPICDYVVESGVFNIRLNTSDNEWLQYILSSLHVFDDLSHKGFAFNMLTKYSDEEYIQKRPDLYYADPCFFFDYCKRNFSRNIALLHDYEIYDFTILVRKN